MVVGRIRHAVLIGARQVHTPDLHLYLGQAHQPAAINDGIDARPVAGRVLAVPAGRVVVAVVPAHGLTPASILAAVRRKASSFAASAFSCSTSWLKASRSIT